MGLNRTIYFVRHAQSVGNAQGIHQGRMDSPLSSQGIRQANEFAELLDRDKIHIDLLVSSPLQRAATTAGSIANRLGLSVVHDPIWMERDSGDYNGQPVETIESLVTSKKIVSLYQQIGGSGESLWDLYLRAGSALQTLLRNGGTKSTMVVSHGGLLRMVFYHILGIGIQPDFRGVHIQLGNCSISKTVYDLQTHQWEIHSLNNRPIKGTD